MSHKAEPGRHPLGVLGRSRVLNKYLLNVDVPLEK